MGWERAYVMESMDADFWHEPGDPGRLVARVAADADLATGSRFVTGGAVDENWGAPAAAALAVGNRLARWIAGLEGGATAPPAASGRRGRSSRARASKASAKKWPKCQAFQPQLARAGQQGIGLAVSLLAAALGGQIENRLHVVRVELHGTREVVGGGVQPAQLRRRPIHDQHERPRRRQIGRSGCWANACSSAASASA